MAEVFDPNGRLLGFIPYRTNGMIFRDGGRVCMIPTYIGEQVAADYDIRRRNDTYAVPRLGQQVSIERDDDQVRVRLDVTATLMPYVLDTRQNYFGVTETMIVADDMRHAARIVGFRPFIPLRDTTTAETVRRRRADAEADKKRLEAEKVEEVPVTPAGRRRAIQIT